MGWSVKSDGFILKKSDFGAMTDLCYNRWGNFKKFTWSTPPYIILFHANFYLIIVYYHHLISEARL